MATEYGRYTIGIETGHAASADPSATSGEASLFVSGSGTDAKFYQVNGNGDKGTVLTTDIVSGDATMAANGALTIANDAVESGMLNDNVISGQSALGSAGVDQADELLFSDAGTLKKVTFSNFEDSIFGNVSGDATIAAGGALTIAANAVEGSMLNTDVISAQTELAHADIADADEMMISDGGTLKKVGVDSLQNHYYGNVSGDATIADGGALTIANDAVENAMIASNAVDDTHIRMQNNTALRFRNAADDEDINAVMVTSGNSLLLGSDAASFCITGSNPFVSASNPSFSLSASAGSNANGGRYSSFKFKGLKADGTNCTMVQLQGAHHGTGDDFAGQFAIKINDGNDAAGSLGTAFHIGYNKAATLYGDVDAQADLDVSGHDGSSAGLKLNGTLVTATAAELNVVDGGTAATSTTVADGDRVVFNDNGTMKQVTVQQMAAYYDDEITNMPNLASAASLATVGTVTSGVWNAGAVTSSGRIISDDATEATSTTDGSMQTDGGLSVAKSAVIGDDLDLLSDSAILNFGADKDVNLTHVADTGLLLNSSMQLQFRDSTEYINSDADGYMNIRGATGVDLNINGTDVVNVTSAGAAVVGTLSCDTSFTLDSTTIDATEIGYLDGVTAGTAAASKALVLDSSLNIGTINRLTASYAKIDQLDVNTINSITSTVSDLEVSDRRIISALSASASDADGGGIRVGGGADSTGHMSVLWDNSNSAMDFNIGGTTEMRLQDGVLRPETDNDVDLGASGAEFKDLYLDGVAYIDDLRADALGAALNCASQAMTNINVDSGAIDGTVIGANSAAAGTFAAIVGTTGTYSGVLKTDDTTEATTTTDGSLQTDGGLSVAKSAVIGDDLDLLSDSAVLNFGADKDVSLTHVADDGLLLNSSRELQFGDADTNIAQSSDGVLKLSADSSLWMSTPDVLISSATDDKPQLELRATNAGANPSTLLFNHDSASPADDDELGEIVFNGDDDGGTSTMFAKIVGVSSDVSDGSEDGMLEFKYRGAGAVKEWQLGGGAGLVGPNDSTYGTVKAHSFVTYSDESLKTNFTALDNPLAMVKKLRGLNYTWKSDGTKDLGFIAQEVEKVVPEVVYSNGGKDGSYGMDYSSLTALLTEAIKQQDDEITSLKATLAKVLAKLDK